MSVYRLGVDIGGTFTDVILVDEESGAVHIDKVLTTPRDPSIAFLDGVERVLRRAGAAPAHVRYVVHATTVATNAIIEGKVARTAFVTTDGFRDMLEIARQVRPSLYDLRFEKPRPLVPRQYCYGVPERLDARGQVLVPLDEAAVRRVADEIASRSGWRPWRCASSTPTRTRRTSRSPGGSCARRSPGWSSRCRRRWRRSSASTSGRAPPSSTPPSSRSSRATSRTSRTGCARSARRRSCWSCRATAACSRSPPRARSRSSWSSRGPPPA